MYRLGAQQGLHPDDSHIWTGTLMLLMVISVVCELVFGLKSLKIDGFRKK